MKPQVRKVDGEWRVWMPKGEGAQGAHLYDGDVIENIRTGERCTVEIGGPTRWPWRRRLVESPGIPCDVEGDDALLHNAVANAVAQAGRAAELGSLLAEVREALATLPVDALGTMQDGTTLPSGESGMMEWSIRDELIDRITRVLDDGPAAGAKLHDAAHWARALNGGAPCRWAPFRDALMFASKLNGTDVLMRWVLDLAESALAKEGLEP